MVAEYRFAVPRKLTKQLVRDPGNLKSVLIVQIAPELSEEIRKEFEKLQFNFSQDLRAKV